jgi:hypothetical protein
VTTARDASILRRLVPDGRRAIYTTSSLETVHTCFRKIVATVQSGARRHGIVGIHGVGVTCLAFSGPADT